MEKLLGHFGLRAEQQADGRRQTADAVEEPDDPLRS